MDTKLEQYVKSGGMYMPPDIDNFILGGEFEDLCAYCERPHHNYDEVSFKDYYDDDFQSRRIIKVAHVCEDCAFEVDVLKSYNFENASFQEGNKEGLPARLRSYISTGELPFNAHMYINIKHLCVFCRDDITDDMYMELEVPVDAGGNIGGYVRACDKCAESIGWSEQHIRYTDKCVVCHRNYPITKEEMVNRKEIASMGSHMCYDCISKVFREDMIEMGIGFERFRTKYCQTCKDTKVVDATQCATGEIRAVCGKCAAYQSTREMVQDTTSAYYFLNFKEFEDTRGLVRKMNSVWICEVQQRSPYDSRMWKVLQTLRYSGEIEDAVWVFRTAILGMLRNEYDER